MSSVFELPLSQGKQVAVIPERVFDPLNGWTLTVDHKILNDLRHQGRIPSIIPVYNQDGDIDIGIFAFLRHAFDEVHGPEDIRLILENDTHLHAAADELIERRRKAGKDPFYARVIVAPDLKNETVKLSQRFTNALRYGSYAVPIIVTHEGELASQIDHVYASGFFLPGSDSDYHPKHYGSTTEGPDDEYDLARDRLVKAIVRTAYDEDFPIFGICSGMQGLAIFSDNGYKLHEDLSELDRHEHTVTDHPQRERFAATHLETIERRSPRRSGAKTKGKRYKAAHNVTFAEGTLTAALLGNAKTSHTVPVNSSHRQALEETTVGSELSIEGVAPDGTIEAIHDRTGSFMVGVQFHPEALFMENVEQHPLERKLYRRLFWAFGQALQGWTWRQIILPRASGGNWRNRGMSRVYMTPPFALPQTPEFVTGIPESIVFSQQ